MSDEASPIVRYIKADENMPVVTDATNDVVGRPMEDYLQSWHDPVLFNFPARNMSSNFQLEFDEMIRLEDQNNFQMLTNLESTDRLNHHMVARNHLQTEIMIPDSQSCMPSSTANIICNDRIKLEALTVNNSMSSNSPPVPTSVSFKGEFEFEIAFEHQDKDTKSVNWTYSSSLNKLYVRMGGTCPIRFRTLKRPPYGCVIRATPVYMKPEHMQEVVTRCPNHTSTKDTNENHPAPKHLVRCEHKLAKYLEDRMTGRQSVIVPHEQPQAGAEWVTNLYQFMCFSSCVGGLSRRPVQLIFTLEHGLNVFGRQSMEVRICACPGRDRKSDEESAKSGTVSSQKTTDKSRTTTTEGSGVSGGQSQLPRKIRKMDDDDERYFTLTVHGRENYELLSRVNEALEMSSRIPDYQKEMYLKQQLPDSQMSAEELSTGSGSNIVLLRDSKPLLKRTAQDMTLSNGFVNYKPILKPLYKPSTNLY